MAKLVYWGYCGCRSSSGLIVVKEKLAMFKKRYPHTKYTVVRGIGYMPVEEEDSQCYKIYNNAYAIFAGKPKIGKSYKDIYTPGFLEDKYFFVPIKEFT